MKIKETIPKKNEISAANERPLWVWISAAYMLASVIFNCWKQLPDFRYLDSVDQATLVFNLVCNFSGAIALLFLRRWAILLLGLGFLDGLVVMGWPIFETYRDGRPLHLPLSLLSFSWPLVMILYAVWLAKRGILR